METLRGNFRELMLFLTPVLPYGVVESWEDIDPRLYHAVHIYWLKFYGMWYNNYSPRGVRYWLQMIYSIVVLWLVCFLPGCGEVVYLLKRSDNIGNIAEGLYLFLSEMYTYFKIAVFWLNKNKILALLEYMHCEEFRPKEKEHGEILTKSIKTARFVMTYYSIMCVGAVSVGIIMPLTEDLEVLPTNVEYPHLDVYRSPMYAIFYIHQIYYKPATCIIDGVMDTILAAFVASAKNYDHSKFCFIAYCGEIMTPTACFIGQIEILSYNLRNFDEIANRRMMTVKTNYKKQVREKYVRDVLRDCIKHHNSIIRFVSMIEGAFSLASVLQFMLSAMVLCLVGMQFLSIDNPMEHPMQIMWMAIYLACMLIEVFILCWFGDELIWKSKDLLQAAFDGPWMDTEQKNKKYIVLFMERCKRPLKVTAGKIFVLSLDTYTVLINWSYKAFAVMSNMKN